ncbi:hypothetical protein RRG08_029016 [Elysia crispata]|uniref:Uncharacterized protein n=1 Tax=Elysia crispata TaxID=231223 RepID=A0AAE0ZHG2_9GAST|nr:hypothetical protein RRG08_029016 [Elysia crispata]
MGCDCGAFSERCGVYLSMKSLFCSAAEVRHSFCVDFPDNIQHINRDRLSNLAVEDLRQVGDLWEEIKASSDSS